MRKTVLPGRAFLLSICISQPSSGDKPVPNLNITIKFSSLHKSMLAAVPHYCGLAPFPSHIRNQTKRAAPFGTQHHYWGRGERVRGRAKSHNCTLICCLDVALALPLAKLTWLQEVYFAHKVACKSHGNEEAMEVIIILHGREWICGNNSAIFLKHNHL